MCTHGLVCNGEKKTMQLFMGCKKEGCVYITHHVVCGGETILKTITKKMQPGGGGSASPMAL